MNKYLDLARELKPSGNKGEGGSSYNWYALNSPKKLERKTGGIGNDRKNQDNPDYSIIEIGQTLRRFLETWGLLSLRLQWKTTSRRWSEKLANEWNNIK